MFLFRIRLVIDDRSTINFSKTVYIQPFGLDMKCKKKNVLLATAYFYSIQVKVCQTMSYIQLIGTCNMLKIISYRRT